MPLIAKTESKEGTFEPIPEGTHLAVCCAVIELGTHIETFNGREKDRHSVVIIWEIPDQRIEVERNGEVQDLPRVVSEKYTLSLYKSNLRRDLEAWRGKAFTDAELEGFDLQKLLGKACQIQIIHRHKDDKTYTNINSLMALPKNIKAPEPENPLTYFSFEDCGTQIPETVPEWCANIIRESREWKASTSGAQYEGKEEQQNQDEDIPF